MINIKFIMKMLHFNLYDGTKLLFHETVINLMMCVMILHGFHLQLLECAPAKSNCSKGWHQIGENCFKVVVRTNMLGYYHIMQAVDDCVSEGGLLATIPDRSTEIELYALIRDTTELHQTQLFDNFKIYIGFTDVMNEGEFEWLDSTQSNYTNWSYDSGEPNNVHQGNEDCTVIVSHDGQWQMNRKTGWNDYHCSVPFFIHGALCQKEMESTENSLNQSQYSPTTKEIIKHLQIQCFGAEVDVCKSNPCYHRGICNNEVTYFTCTCPKGHTGELCQFKQQCPAAPCILNSIRSEPSTNLRYYYGDTIQYVCAEGFVFDDNSTIGVVTTRCDEFGKWIPDIPSCKEVFCPEITKGIMLVPFGEGSRLTPKIQNKKYSYGARLNYTCKEGYVFSNATGSSYISGCGMSGEWYPPFYICKEVHCPPVPTWLGIRFQVSNNMGEVDAKGVIKTYPYNMEISYNCSKEGYILIDQNISASASCDITGHWYPDILECVEKEKKEGKAKKEEEPVESPGAAAFGSMGIIVMITEVVLLVLIDLDTLCRHIGMFFRNITYRCRHPRSSNSQNNSSLSSSKADNATSPGKHIYTKVAQNCDHIEDVNYTVV